MLKNNRGFSLIELMVVVAIIGLLASFAIPQYSSFQARARQKEGQSLLSSYYTGVKASEADIGGIYTNFVTAGFNPTGQLHYRVVTGAQAIAAANAPRNGTPYLVACVTTAGAVCAAATSFFDGAAVQTGNVFVPQWVEVLAVGAFYIPTASCAAAAPTATTFEACARSIIRSGGTNDDWRINQAKSLINVANGVL